MRNSEIKLFSPCRNQEEVETIKGKIDEQSQRREECAIQADHTRTVIGSIKDNLLDLLLKLREVDELTERPIMKKVFQEFGDISEVNIGNFSSSQLLKMLQEALRLGLMASGQMTKELEASIVEMEEQLDIRIPLQSPSSAAEGQMNMDMIKRTAFPPCYVNLLANRGTGAVTACSPGQPNPTGKKIWVK